MGYQVQFDSAVSFETACQALDSDLRGLGLPPLKDYGSIQRDEAKRSLHFDANAMELGILFGDKRGKTASLIPFSLEDVPPDSAGFDKIGMDRGITGVTVTRDGGDIVETYRQARTEAAQFFKDHPSLEPVEKRPSNDADTYFHETVQQGKVAVINEEHGDQAHLRYLTDRMPELGAKGGSLLLEHVFQDQQPLLDAYFKSQPGSPMPPELAAHIDRFIDPCVNVTGAPQLQKIGRDGKPEHIYTTRELMETAQRNGVRLIGTETEESFSTRGLRLANRVDGIPASDDMYGLTDRLLLLNREYIKIVKKLQAEHPGAPIVTLAGANHGIDYPSEGRVPGLDKIPGVGPALGAPTLFAIDPDHVESQKGTLAYEQSTAAFSIDSTGKPRAGDDAQSYPNCTVSNGEIVTPSTVPKACGIPAQRGGR